MAFTITQTDKRRFSRLACDIPSTVRNLDDTDKNRYTLAETTVRDISEGGIRFRSNHFIAVHHRLLFKLNMPRQRPIEAMGRPAWIAELPHLGQYEIGAQFTSLSAEDRGLIRAFVAGR